MFKSATLSLPTIILFIGLLSVNFELAQGKIGGSKVVRLLQDSSDDSTESASATTTDSPTESPTEGEVDPDFGVDPPLDPTFSFGDTTFFGSGCPAGTVQIVKSSDEQTVSVLFSEYIAETNDVSSRDRLSCNLAVPVDVKPGFSIGIYKVDYRGFAEVPGDGGRDSARFYAEYFFAGIRGPTMSKTFKDGFADDFFITNEINVATVVYSPCGGSTVFRINTSITASKDSSSEISQMGGNTIIGIDTIDTTISESQNYGFMYFVTKQACED